MEDDDDSVQGPYEIFRLHGLLCQSERTNVFETLRRPKRASCSAPTSARGFRFRRRRRDGPSRSSRRRHDVRASRRSNRASRFGWRPCSLQPKEREYADVLADEGVSFADGSAVAMLNVLDDAKDATERDKSMFKSMPHLHPAAQRMQKKLLAKVASDKPYDVLAKDAFRAHVRAYATFPSKLKHIFHVKRLHLGHVAAAFGLKDAPQLIGASATKAAPAPPRTPREEIQIRRQARQGKTHHQAREKARPSPRERITHRHRLVLDPSSKKYLVFANTNAREG